jgi:hypothetical protein
MSKKTPAKPLFAVPAAKAVAVRTAIHAGRAEASNK